MTDNGHYRKYRDIKFGQDSLDLIGQANKIIKEYEKKGFILTLRQLYYQFVARGLLSNTKNSYNRLGSVISDGRIAGMVSWLAIEDRTRNLMGSVFYDNPTQLIRSVKTKYRIDKWLDQPFRPEVWIEKEALVGVISGICQRLEVDFFACKGYNSQSEQWRAGQRFAGYYQKGQRPIVFHLGDHDPSGIDMTRDNQERLSLFAGVEIQVVRLALNWNQIQQYNPPPNPAKITDSRFSDYEKKFGSDSWELDALDPTVIETLISDSVLKVRDDMLWQEAVAKEVDDKLVLDDLINQIERGADE